MSKVETAIRSNPLDGLETVARGIRITPLPAAYRLSLRAPEASLLACSKALGVDLPKMPKGSSIANGGKLLSGASKRPGRIAFWLGPDEWLVIDHGDHNPFDDCAKIKALHSATDISHRNLAIDVEGVHAMAVLAAGCPQDLSNGVFPVGACSRTILGKAEVVIWRVEEQLYRVECWRSFGEYVFDFLTDAARSTAA